MLLNDKKVFVGKFLTRAERMKKMGERVRLFTNIYIKNFGDKLDEEKLKEMFEVRNTVCQICLYKIQLVYFVRLVFMWDCFKKNSVLSSSSCL